MGQKVNAHGLRVGVIKDWDSRWYTPDAELGDTLVSDYNLRNYLKKRLQSAGVPRIEIERTNAGHIRFFIHCAKPGLVIGKGGADIEKLKKDLEKMSGKTVSVNVVEVKNPDMNAQLVAENITSQLERRISFRRAMKMAIRNTMESGAKGIKISCGGRLGGAEIARTEHYHEGTIPMQTLRADIEYGFWEANTTYGKIGVKVWIYKGEVLADSKASKARNAVANAGMEKKKPARDRRDNRRGGDRRPGGDRRQNGDRRPGGDRRQGAPRTPRAPKEGGAN